MKDTLGKLIDNGLLNQVGQITVANASVCRSWRFDDDIVFKDATDTEGTEIQFFVLEFDDQSTSRFRLDSEVIFDGFDLHVVEDYSKSEHTLSFQKLIDIDPEKFLNKN